MRPLKIAEGVDNPNSKYRHDTLREILLLVLGTITFLISSFAIYRFYFHPLEGYLGEKLAAPANLSLSKDTGYLGMCCGCKNSAFDGRSTSSVDGYYGVCDAPVGRWIS
ncbi:hypothetical protein F4781DRAFT_435546 [Annulohypoxylon bovei var. microspora]|nr:hypothetical protein F4781DRAFT_435546 [Annulohypoxylon bovei var. microspora]